MNPIVEATSGKEAREMMFSALSYFWGKYPKWTTIAVMLIAGAVLFVAFHYIEMVGLPKIQIEKAKPIGERVQFQFMPAAQALGGEPIVIEGKLYGYADPRFKAWVLSYESSILVWDKYRREVYTVKMETDLLREKK